MQVIEYSDLLDTRASRGIVKDYFETAEDVKTPADMGLLYDIHLDIYRSDPIISTAIDMTVDFVTGAGYYFISDKENDEKRLKEVQDMFDNLFDFDQVSENITRSMLIYGAGYMELRMLGDKIGELWPLETTEMAIRYDENGRVEGYVQKPRTKDASEIPFTPEEVIYFPLKKLGSRVESYSPLEPISRSFTTKLYANDYLQRIFKNLPPKILWVLKQADKTQRRQFIENLIKAKNNPALDLVATGEASSELVQYKFDDGLIQTLEYLRRDVLMVTRVPPFWVGIDSGSDRGGSEAIILSYETYINKIKRKQESIINRELLPKLGFEGITIKYHPTTLSDEKSVVEVARNLRDMGFDDDTVIGYLKSKGVKISKTAQLDDKNLMDEKGFESRKRMDKGTDKMAESSKINQKGVSDAGKAKMQEKGVKMRSMNKYWTYDTYAEDSQ